MMKKIFLTLTLLGSIGAFVIAANSISTEVVSSEVYCEGDHKCDDKCKKDKDGKCKADSKKSKGKDGKACCAHGDKAKKDSKETKKSNSSTGLMKNANVESNE